MSAEMETVTPTPEPKRARRWRRWAWAGVAVVMLGWAGRYFVVELPERRAEVELAKLRAAHARTVPGLGLDLVWIAPGTFKMGAKEQNFIARWYYDARRKFTNKVNPADVGWFSEHPVTEVTLTRAFWLGQTEVTQAQWMALTISNPSVFKGDGLPVVNVSWEDAMEFCRKLTEREKRAGRLPAGYEFNLPTQAQWEYACRAGTTGDYSGKLKAMAWYGENSGGVPHPVGTKNANSWNLFDMHGNVWEWCRDALADYPGGTIEDPYRVPLLTPATSGMGSTLVVARGGGFDSSATGCRSAQVGADGYTEHRSGLGFRVALVPSP
jgi:formylglycine-generating enzyme required for sulfatase activity